MSRPLPYLYIPPSLRKDPVEPIEIQRTYSVAWVNHRLFRPVTYTQIMPPQRKLFNCLDCVPDENDSRQAVVLEHCGDQGHRVRVVFYWDDQAEGWRRAI